MGEEAPFLFLKGESEVVVVEEVAARELEPRCLKVKVAQPCLTLSWNSPGQNIGVGKPFPSPGDLPNSGIEPRSPASQVDSLPAEAQGKPKMLKGETEVGNPIIAYLKSRKAIPL